MFFIHVVGEIKD